MGNLDFLDPAEQEEGKLKRPSSSARLRRAEAERELANYEALVQTYLAEGEFSIEDEIDQARRSVSAVLESAQKEGAIVTDLIEQWMQFSARVIDAKKSLHE